MLAQNCLTTTVLCFLLGVSKLIKLCIFRNKAARYDGISIILQTVKCVDWGLSKGIVIHDFQNMCAKNAATDML